MSRPDPETPRPADEVERGLAAWRAEVAATPAPDVERAWRSIRRRLGEGGEARADVRRASPWLRWGVPAGAFAAMLLVVVFVLRRDDPAGNAQLARAELVELADPALTPVVFVDEQTGWLVVWASPELVLGGT